MKKFVLFAGMLCAGAAFAQVYKCPDASGRIVYSDSACGGQLLRDGQLTGNTMQRTESPHTRTDPAPAPANNSAPAQSAGTAAPSGGCPSDLDIQNLETSASSISIGRKEREFLQNEIRRARACAKEGGNYSREDWQRIRDAQADQNRIDPKDRAAARARAEGTHAPAVSDREHERMMNDQQIEARREAAEQRRAAARQMPRFNGCSAGLCRDSLGTTYRELPAGGGLTRNNDGARCTVVDGYVRC